MSRFRSMSRGLIRERGKMNQTEALFAEYLSSLDDVHWWQFEPLTLRLSHPEEGQPARVSPDFLVCFKDGTTVLYDVKGPRNREGKTFDDPRSMVALKCAAEQFPIWSFQVVRKVKSGGWEFKEL